MNEWVTLSCILTQTLTLTFAQSMLLTLAPTTTCRKFADGKHAYIMEVLRRGGMEAERILGDPLRRFTALLTKARLTA